MRLRYFWENTEQTHGIQRRSNKSYNTICPREDNQISSVHVSLCLYIWRNELKYVSLNMGYQRNLLYKLTV